MASRGLQINHIGDVEEIEKIPLEARFKEQTAYDIIEGAAKKWAERNALTFLPSGSPLAKPVTFTYKQIFDRVNQTANLLLSIGVKSGDAISYILPSIPENYFLFFSSQAVGIANPISFSLPPEQIAELLRTAGSKILFTTGSKTNPQLWDNLLTVRNLYPGLKKIIVLEDETDLRQSIYNFYDLLSTQSSSPLFQKKKINSKAICSYFHTSGTMGPPKLVQHTHHGVVYIAWVAGIFAKYERTNSVILSGLPMFHVAAPVVEALSAFFYGASMVVMSPLGWSDPSVIPHFWKIVEKYHGTSMVAVPPIYKALLKVPLNGADTSSLYSTISGNVAISEEDFNQFKALTNVSIATLWGQTEALVGCFNFSSTSKSKNFGSAGIRLPYEQIKIVKLDKNGNVLRNCLPMEEGVLCIKGPNVNGYKVQALNKTAFSPAGWFNTGDWAYQNAEGYIWILGRQADFIQYNGKYISLLEIETTLHQHPKIKKAAAISLSDENLDIFVMLHEGTHMTVDDVNQYINDSLKEKYGLIKMDIEFRHELPLNGMGKVLKYILKEELQRRKINWGKRREA
ncbi:MAG: AMP-binding protein [Alphaproteobacteria bacterium]|nr:AMP-binding protein [Alphaproteobacteria bacterium]